MVKKSHMMLFPWLLVLYEVSIYLSMDAYMPALPDITRVFGTTISLAQLTATAWMLGGFLLQLVFGPLSDRYGRRPILLWGGVLYVLSSVFCALAPTIHLLLFARLLQGIAMPSMYIAGYAAINERFETEKAVHILALMNAVTILAPAFGPILGAAFLMVMGWRWIFVILGMWAAITVAALYFKMPETVTEEQREKQIDLRTICRQYRAVISNKRFINSALVAFLPTVGMISWMLAGPFIVTSMFHHSTLVFGLIQSLIFGSFIIATKVITKIATQAKYPFFIHLGLGISCAGSILGVICSYALSSYLWPLVISIMVVSFGVGLSLPILSRLTLEKSQAPMGVRVTIFSVIRIGSGLLGSVALACYYNSTLLSMAVIIAVFTMTAGVLSFLDGSVRQPSKNGN